MHRVPRLPALVQPECFLAAVLALRIQTALEPVERDQMHRFGQKVLYLDVMELALIVHHARLMEETVHVALQLVILVDLLIAEPLDGICVCVFFDTIRRWSPL